MFFHHFPGHDTSIGSSSSEGCSTLLRMPLGDGWVYRECDDGGNPLPLRHVVSDEASKRDLLKFCAENSNTTKFCAAIFASFSPKNENHVRDVFWSRFDALVPCFVENEFVGIAQPITILLVTCCIVPG